MGQFGGKLKEEEKLEGRIEKEREMKEGKRDDCVRHHNPNVARCSCAGDR
jgi:hypothetical protein